MNELALFIRLGFFGVVALASKLFLTESFDIYSRSGGI